VRVPPHHSPAQVTSQTLEQLISTSIHTLSTIK
jgi:hypothetical protein